MLVFGAVAFKSCNDGGIEVIVDGQHQFIAANDVAELSNWIQFHRTNNQKTNPYYGGLNPAPELQGVMPNWAAVQAQEGVAVG